MFRLILPLVGGILIGIYSDLSSKLWLLFFAITLISIILLGYSAKKFPSYRKEILFGLNTYLCIFLLGINLVVFKTSKNAASHYSHAHPSSNRYIVHITEIPKEKPNSVQTIVSIDYVIDSNQQTYSTSGSVLLYFEKDSLSKKLLQGDVLLLECNLSDIKTPQNPGQFNYKQYLSFNQIYQQGFVKSKHWKLLETDNFSLVKFAAKIRQNLMSILESQGLQDNQLAVASALILGYKDDLDDDLKRSYSSAGATHVLAVSGLHVGIIYMVLNFLLQLIDKKEKYPHMRLGLLLTMLWFYALLTGLSPSVVRAATMFTFVAAGKAFGRSSTIYNTLASSAFVLLVYNPFLIMEVGFQLSYLAVLGIVYFQPIVYRKLYVKNKFLDYVWSITSVSIAAQLTTFPLGLLYFHQFPTYFFVSNLFVIPGAMVIIALGLVVFATHWIPFVGAFFGFLLKWTISAMNSLVFSIDKLPKSLIDGISISILECWIIYLIILLLVLSFESRKLRFFNLSLGLLIVLLFLDLSEDRIHRNSYQIVIYQTKQDCINFIDSDHNYFIADTSLTHDKSQMLFNITHHWDDLDAPKAHLLVWESNLEDAIFFKDEEFIQFHALKIAAIDTLNKVIPKKPIQLDLLYLRTSSYVSIDEILSHFVFKQLVLGNEVHWKTEKECLVSKTLVDKVHSISKDGAYISRH